MSSVVLYLKGDNIFLWQKIRALGDLCLNSSLRTGRFERVGSKLYLQNYPPVTFLWISPQQQYFYAYVKQFKNLCLNCMHIFNWNLLCINYNLQRKYHTLQVLSYFQIHAVKCNSCILINIKRNAFSLTLKIIDCKTQRKITLLIHLQPPNLTKHQAFPEKVKIRKHTVYLSPNRHPQVLFCFFCT